MAEAFQARNKSSGVRDHRQCPSQSLDNQVVAFIRKCAAHRSGGAPVLAPRGFRAGAAVQNSAAPLALVVKSRDLHGVANDCLYPTDQGSWLPRGSSCAEVGSSGADAEPAN
jgi:hypothetical protein